MLKYKNNINIKRKILVNKLGPSIQVLSDRFFEGTYAKQCPRKSKRFSDDKMVIQPPKYLNLAFHNEIPSF